MSVINEPACYLLVRENGKLLFVMRSKTGYMDGNYSLPAGRVEEGEPYASGSVREAFEEVGLTVARSDIHHVFTLHRRAGGDNYAWTDVFFEADSWAGEPLNAEPHKHSAIAWLPVDDLPGDIMDYQHFALTQIAAGKTYGEFGWEATAQEL